MINNDMFIVFFSVLCYVMYVHLHNLSASVFTLSLCLIDHLTEGIKHLVYLIDMDMDSLDT